MLYYSSTDQLDDDADDDAAAEGTLLAACSEKIRELVPVIYTEILSEHVPLPLTGMNPGKGEI